MVVKAMVLSQRFFKLQWTKPHESGRSSDMAVITELSFVGYPPVFNTHFSTKKAEGVFSFFFFFPSF